MRRFFSFRSSASSSGNSNPSSPTRDIEKATKEQLQKKDAKVSKSGKIKNGLRSSNSVEGQPCPYNKIEASSNVRLRRSLSFSHPAVYPGSQEENSRFWNGLSPSSCGDSLHHEEGCPVYNSRTPERRTTARRGKMGAIWHSHLTQKMDSPDSSRGYPCSSGNSPYSSPIPLKCRAPRIGHENRSDKKVLDLYIDGEHQNTKCEQDCQQRSSAAGTDCCLRENRILSNSGRPPRAHPTAPSSPTLSKENILSYSFRETKDAHRHLSSNSWVKDDPRPLSPKDHTRKVHNKLSYVYSEKLSSRLHECDSETTATVEDIYEDSSNLQPLDTESHVYSQSFDPTQIAPNLCCYGAEESLDYQSQSLLPRKGSKFLSEGVEEHDTDKELIRKEEDMEQKLMLLIEEDSELSELTDCTLDISALVQKIGNILEDRRCLAVELTSQIKSRLAERSSSRQLIGRVKAQLDTRTRRLEKEKSELQSSLERELDRRSADWSLKLEKFQSEEQRLRERVRDLAEQNVSLQREISSLKGHELDHRSRIVNSEMQLSDLTASLEELRKENSNLHQNLFELQDRVNASDAALASFKSTYKEKEREIMDLQKVVVRLQRICSEQDKTINGLRKGYADEFEKHPMNPCDNISRLQLEQLRLVDLERKLRGEVESCRRETESLRQENMCLLDRWRRFGNGDGFLFKLNNELRSQVDRLQSKGLQLLDDSTSLSGELLGFEKSKQYESDQGVKSNIDQYSVVELTTKYQSLKRGICNLRRELQTTLSTFDDKSNIEAVVCQLHEKAKDESRQPNSQVLEDADLKLKSEILLNGLLREKLLSKELELEQLQADLASSISGHDVLRSEIQRLQDDISGLIHKTKNTELQVLNKDESIKQLHQDLQECTKDLIATRSRLMHVAEERDQMWQDVKSLSETKMLLEHEVGALKKKVDALNDDVLYKEGQISILKDSLGDKQSDSILLS